MLTATEATVSTQKHASAFHIPRIPNALLGVFLLNVAFGLSSVGYSVNGPVWCRGCYNVQLTVLAFLSTKLTLWNSYRNKTFCRDTWAMNGCIFSTSSDNICLSEGLFDWQYQEQEERSAGRASTSGSPTSPCRMTSLTRWELDPFVTLCISIFISS